MEIHLLASRRCVILFVLVLGMSTVGVHDGFTGDEALVDDNRQRLNGNVQRGSSQQASVSCTAKLTVSNPVLSLGELFEFSVVVHNTTGAAISLLNPLYSPLVPIVTVDLLIYDGDGMCVGELYRLGRRDGSYQKLGETHWLNVPPDALIGKADRARASIVVSGVERLNPGRYRLQMVFRDTFVSEYPFSGLPPPPDPRYVERLDKWKEKHPGTELFRSNAVDIEILKRK
jgi:hypothetical protein